MRRADRLLQIVQILRRRGRPTTAEMLAEELEVVPRTIYRDIATLQAARVPIDGAAGIGYILRAGYDLPPLMFSHDEIEAIVLGARMVMERGDAALAKAANDVQAKVEVVAPKASAEQMWKAELLVPHALETGVDFGPFIPDVRAAVRQSRKLSIAYADANGASTERTIWPLGLYLFSHVTLVCAMCEMRGDFRAFRSDRISKCQPLDDHFDPQHGGLMKQFMVRFAQERL